MNGKKQTLKKRAHGCSQRRGYAHPYPWTQQGPGASIAAHPARKVDWQERTYTTKSSDIACAIMMLLAEREPAEPSLALLLFSSVLRALCAGTFELSARLPTTSPPPRRFILPRGNGRTFAAGIARIRLLAHCAQPVPRKNIDVWVPRQRLL